LERAEGEVKKKITFFSYFCFLYYFFFYLCSEFFDVRIFLYANSKTMFFDSLEIRYNIAFGYILALRLQQFQDITKEKYRKMRICVVCDTVVEDLKADSKSAIFISKIFVPL